MSVSKELAHDLLNLSQMVLGHIEMHNLDLARRDILRLAQVVRAETTPTNLRISTIGRAGG